MSIYYLLGQESYYWPFQNHPSFQQPPKPVAENVSMCWTTEEREGLQLEEHIHFVILHFFPAALLPCLVPQLQDCESFMCHWNITQHCCNTCQSLSCFCAVKLVTSSCSHSGPTCVLRQYLPGLKITISPHQSSYRGSRLFFLAQLWSDFLLQGHFPLGLA